MADSTTTPPAPVRVPSATQLVDKHQLAPLPQRDPSPPPRKPNKPAHKKTPSQRQLRAEYRSVKELDVRFENSAHSRRVWSDDGDEKWGPMYYKAISVPLPADKVVLNLSFKNLAELPAELFQLTALRVLDLHGNALKALPPAISQLQQLRVLHLGYNQLENLPEEIGQLTSLRELNLTNNRLKTLPSSFYSLTRLRQLVLWGNALTTLPPELGRLVRLRTLSLFRNELESLPDELCQLSELRELALTGNPLRQPLPSRVHQLQQLRTLHLWGVHLGPQLPDAVCQLAALTELDVRGNRLERLPPALCQLGRLAYLNVASNQLYHLPQAIHQLTSLTLLDITHNRIAALPPQLSKLPQLRVLEHAGNPIHCPPSAILAKGLARAMDYLGGLLPGQYYDGFLLDMCTRCLKARLKEKDSACLQAIVACFPGSVVLRHFQKAFRNHSKTAAAAQSSASCPPVAEGALAAATPMVLSPLQAAADGDGGVAGLTLAVASDDTQSVREVIRMHMALLHSEDGRVVQEAVYQLSALVGSHEAVAEEEGVRAGLIGVVRGPYATSEAVAAAAGLLTQLCLVRDFANAAAILHEAGAGFQQHLVEVARSRGGKYLKVLLRLACDQKIALHTPIDPREVVLDRPIGKGATAVIYAGQYRGQAVAVKKFFEEVIELREFLAEIAIMSLLRHDRLVTCIGASTTYPHYYLVTRLFQGSLLDWIYKDNPSSAKVPSPAPAMEMSLALRMACDIVEGMAYLHSLDIIHRDLKPGNCLFDEAGRVYVADFGIARVVEAVMTKGMGTPRYMAPEILEGKQYSEKADVYSFAIILWELLTGKAPFVDFENSWQLANAIINGTRPPIPEFLPSQLKHLLRMCWHKDADLRPSFHVVLATLQQLQISLVKFETHKSDQRALSSALGSRK